MAKAVKQVTTKTKPRKPAAAGKPGKKKPAPLVANAAAVKRSAPTMHAGPTKRGRKVLELVESYQRLWDSPPEEGTKAWRQFQRRVVRITHDVRAIGKEISARPVRTVSDVIDRAIILAHENDPGFDVESKKVLPQLAGILGIAGIRPSQCCTGEFARVDRIAGVAAR